MRILCFGDSNTWGTIPDGTCDHCDIKTAYPYLLQKRLGKGYHVICEGMPSRTTDLDDIKFPKGNRNGSLFFPQCLISHDPIDWVVLFLGTNDLKSKFNRNVKQISNVIEEKYINFTFKDLAPELTTIPKFILVAPPIIDEEKFDKGGIKAPQKNLLNLTKSLGKLQQKTNVLLFPTKF